ncbi:hypothetical protein MRB53_010095 [Persea americana]|uniref:Uncharacterized protein n=1 Tax=Persea americana TaxID=3435 RepID=A0ACC2LQZ4_PERAE|nr:hypothetical protein MRB53_010095 [Persea americana]
MGYQSPCRCDEVVSDCRSIETEWRSGSNRESVEVPRSVAFATVIAATRGETRRDETSDQVGDGMSAGEIGESVEVVEIKESEEVNFQHWNEEMTWGLRLVWEGEMKWAGHEISFQEKGGI